MGHNKVKFGIKWFDGIIYDIAYISNATNGFVWGAVKDGKHVTLLKDTNSVSSHLTIQDTNYHKPIARLYIESIPTKDEISKAIFNPRLIRDDELDDDVIYITQKFADATNSISMNYVEITEGNTLYCYLDLHSIIEQAKNMVLDMQKEPYAYFGICKIRDIKQNKDLIGIRSNKKVVTSIDYELWELTMPSLDPISFEDETLNNLVEFIGYSSISEGIKTNIEKIKNGS